jgi:hypothetical protein
MEVNQGETSKLSQTFSNFPTLYRKASFVSSFNEQEIKSSNIRYLFPEGCESPSIHAEIPVIEVKGTAEEIPECIDTCCEVSRPQIFFPSPNKNSCCKAISKLVVPIDLTELEGVPTAAIDEFSAETDVVSMLVKLMKLIEATRK